MYSLIEDKIKSFLSEINTVFNPNRDDLYYEGSADERLEAFWRLMDKKDEWMTEQCPEIKNAIMSVIEEYQYEWKLNAVLSSMSDEIQLKCIDILRQ